MENGVKQCIPLNILFIWEKLYVRIQVREKEIYLYTLLANPKRVKGLYILPSIDNKQNLAVI